MKKWKSYFLCGLTVFSMISCLADDKDAKHKTKDEYEKRYASVPFLSQGKAQLLASLGFSGGMVGALAEHLSGNVGRGLLWGVSGCGLYVYGLFSAVLIDQYMWRGISEPDDILVEKVVGKVLFPSFYLTGTVLWNNTFALKLLLDQSKQITIIHSIALILAIRLHHNEAALLLLEYGADPLWIVNGERAIDMVGQNEQLKKKMEEVIAKKIQQEIAMMDAKNQFLKKIIT